LGRHANRLCSPQARRVVCGRWPLRDGPHFHWDYYNSFVISPCCWIRCATFARIAAGGKLCSRCPGARAAVRGYPGAADCAGRHLSRHRPLHRLPLRRLSSVGPDGARARATRSLTGPQVRCALTAVTRRLMKRRERSIGTAGCVSGSAGTSPNWARATSRPAVCIFALRCCFRWGSARPIRLGGARAKTGLRAGYGAVKTGRGPCGLGCGADTARCSRAPPFARIQPSAKARLCCFSYAVRLCPGAGRFYGDRASMVCLPARFRSAASTCAPPPALTAIPGSPPFHGRAFAQLPLGRAFR